MATETLPAPAPERKLTLRELMDELQAWQDAEEMPGLEPEDREFIAVTKQQVAAMYDDKVDRTAWFLKRLESDEKGWYKDQDAIIAKRRAQIRRICERRRKYLVRLMKAANQKALRGRTLSIILCRENETEVKIDNESAIPDGYCHIEPEQVVIIPARRVVHEAEVEAALRAGKEVPGARLIECEPYIQIR